MPTERKVDWERIKRCFAVLHREARPFLGQALLIGGAACWFYRIQLRNAGDPDFTVPLLAPETESLWLSKDMDFTGIFSADALALLPQRIVTDATGRSHIEVEGVRLGFAQAGLTIDPEAALETAQLAGFDDAGRRVEFLVADPVTLYREKQALSQRRNQPQDHLHLSLLREYLAWRVVTQCERLLAADSPSVAEIRSVTSFLSQVNSRAPEILNDSRITRRLKPPMQRGGLAAQLLRDQLRLVLATGGPNG